MGAILLSILSGLLLTAGFPKPAMFYLAWLPFAWDFLEWVRAFAISGFPWANLGYTQTPINRLIQIADITGVYGLSWLVVFGNTVVSGFIRNFYSRLGVAVLCACIVCALLYGFWRSEQIRGLQNQTGELNVGVIQGNIAQNEKWDPAFEAETISRYARLSLECVKKEPIPDILVW